MGKITIQDVEGKSLQDAVENAWKLRVSSETLNPYFHFYLILPVPLYGKIETRI